MEKIELTQTIEEKAFARFHVSNMYAGRWWMWAVTLIAILALPLYVVSFFTLDIPPFQLKRLAWMAGSLFISLVPVLVYVSMQKAFRRRIQPEQPIRYSFTAEHFGIHSQTLARDLPWERIDRVEERKNWLLVYETKVAAHIIHKSNFKEEDLIWVKGMIRTIPGVKSKLKKRY